MLEQERWGRDRFEPLVMLAQTAAGTADALFELISLVQKHSVLSWDVDGTILRDAWMRCYRRPVSLEAVIANLAVNPEIAPAEIQPSQYRRGKREGGKQFREWLERLLTGKLTERESNVAKRLWQRSYRHHLEEIRSQARGDGEPVPATMPTWLGNAEFMFFLAVVAPCMVHFQTTPWKLYRTALEGDFRALEKLVRLDRRILTEKRIADLWHRMERRGGEGVRLLLEAASQGVKKPTPRAGVKYLVGGWLLNLSDEWQYWLDGEGVFEIVLQKAAPEKLPEVLKWIEERRAAVVRNRVHCRLNAPAVAELYHALHRDAGGGRYDPDFHKAGKTVYRRLERNAALWMSLRKGNKTRAA